MSRFDYGITFNGQHTYHDLGLILLSKTIEYPARSPVLVKPPYSNVPIDLSNLYGHTVFEDRAYKAEFYLKGATPYTKEELAAKYTSVVAWLEGSMGRQPLIDDTEPGYYYVGEPVKSPDRNELLRTGHLTIEWTCNPYRVAVNQEGGDRWNSFAFEKDVAQQTEFAVDGELAFMLVNSSSELLQPTITTDADMVLLDQSGNQLDLAAGPTTPLNQAYPLTLKTGVNYLAVTGTGHISFEWYKEVI